MRLGSVPIDDVTFDQALEAIARLVDAGQGGFVLTPNVDHIVMAESDERLRRAYARADLSLVDGMPVLWAARWLDRPLREKVSGSDLVLPLMTLAERRGYRVYLLGGAPGVAERAAAELGRRLPALVVAGTASPRVDMSEPPRARESIVAAIRAARPDLVLVSFGAPKQELFIAEVATAIAPAVALGVGAAIDFLAGTAHRAPAWVSSHGLEWAYRLAHEPRRLWRRYLVRDPQFALVVLRERREDARRRRRGAQP